MRRSFPLRYGALGAALLAFGAAANAAPPGRERFRMDGGWRFYKGEPAGEGMAGGIAISGWRWKAEPAGANAATLAAPDLDTGDWQNAAPAQDTFGGRQGFSWYRATLGDVAGPSRLLHFESVDDSATVYLNGRKLASHEGWDEPFDVALDAAWRASGPNVVAVRVQNTNGAGGIGEARLQSRQSDAPAPTPAFARPDFQDRAWRTVHLPHDFVVEGTFDPKANESHGFLPAGVGWYRKTFTLPASDKGRRLVLDFDGVFRDSRVFLNGRLLGRHPSGYTGFRYDISDAANFGGTNVLAVRADARAFEGWWYEGGGIYRHVYLTKTDPLHVAPYGTFAHATVDGPDFSRPDSATLHLKTTLVNDGTASAACTLVSEIVAPGGQIVARAAAPQTVAPGASVEIPQQVRLANPLLWSIETPRLYRVVTRIERAGGQTTDTVTTPFGVRTIRFDAERGFFLNGRPVKIKGTCNHQDFAGVGVALPDSLLEWRIQKLKEMGSNAYRCSHNPPASELLDACDRLGMIVLEESRHIGDTWRGKTPSGTPAVELADLKEMVLRDRNHPSIIMWSMGNEEPLQGSDEGAKLFAAMRTATLTLDPTRPVTSAMNGGWGQGFSLVQDLQGANYNPGGYDDYHRRFPLQPFYGSETASAVSTRGIYVNDPVKGYVSAYDVNAPPWAQPAEVAWRALAERPFMAGGFVWTGFDYKGEPTPYSWPCINSHFGILDICGFPKDTYYYYKAWWGDKPIVHVLPHWNAPGKEGQPVDVWVHGNTERVELFLNGRSLGEPKPMPRNGHLEWKVPYAPGKLEARGYNGTAMVASDAVETTGPPAALRLTTDRTTFTTDGEDVVLAAVAVVDNRGRVVPTASDEVTFTLSGGAAIIAGVGNGDPSSHEPDKASSRSAFNGLCLAVVQAAPGAARGSGTVTLTAPGLRAATLVLTARAPGPSAPKELP